jgi:hypothetical protein
MNPMPAPPDNGEPEEKWRPHAYTTSGLGNGPAGKKLVWKEKWLDSRSLARLDNFPQIFKKPRYYLNIEGVMQVSPLELMTTLVVAAEPQ